MPQVFDGGFNLSLGLGTIRIKELDNDAIVHREAHKLTVGDRIWDFQLPVQDNLLMLLYRIVSVNPPKYMKALRCEMCHTSLDILRN